MLNSVNVTGVPLHCDDVVVRLKLPIQGKIVSEGKKSLIDVDSLVRQSMDSPDSYPPIRHAVVAGDRIVIACSAFVAGLEELLAIVVSYFVESGISQQNLTLLLSERCRFSQDRFDASLQQIIERRTFASTTSNKSTITIVTHGSESSSNDFAYVAADTQAHPLYVHRLLVDADFVLCIAQLSSPRDFQSASVGGIAPWFCDRDSRKRWNASVVRNPLKSGHLSDHTRDLQWLLGPGVTMTVGNDWRRDASSINVQANTSVGLNSIRSDSADDIPLTHFDVVAGSLNATDGHVSWSAIASALETLARHVKTRRGRILLICKNLPSPTQSFTMLSQHLQEEDSLADALSKSSDPFAIDVAYIASLMRDHSIFTFENSGTKQATLPWETMKSVEDCESLLRTASSPAIIL